MLFMTYDAQPALRCAICEKPILLASKAAVVYPRGIEPGEMHRICLTHGGPCLEKAQAQTANAEGPGLCMEFAEYSDRLQGMHGRTI